MPPPLLFELDNIDLDHVLYGPDQIEEVNPHRFGMRQIDGIVHLDLDAGTVVAFKDVAEDEFWVRGHIPGRPLMPGVLMVEAAAQMASFAVQQISRQTRFIGFGGIQDVKFRGQVVPGSRLYLLGKFLENRPRRFKLVAQGLVDGRFVFEGVVVGMPI